jgi:hypothetical protein
MQSTTPDWVAGTSSWIFLRLQAMLPLLPHFMNSGAGVSYQDTKDSISRLLKEFCDSKVSSYQACSADEQSVPPSCSCVFPFLSMSLLAIGWQPESVLMYFESVAVLEHLETVASCVHVFTHPQDMGEASRCLHSLNVPFFHHEVRSEGVLRTGLDSC